MYLIKGIIYVIYIRFNIIVEYFREMLKSYPPSVHQWSSNQQNSMISECRLLIEKEFPDDSEDEEYCPDKNLEDDEEEEYDDEESKFSEMNKSSFETDGEIENDNNSVLSLNDKV